MSNYIDGRSLKKYCCKDCPKEITWETAIHGGGRCKYHAQLNLKKLGKSIYKLNLLQGKDKPNWKGGRRKTVKGYILVYSPNHPFRGKSSYVLEHRLIMEKYLGRYLTKNEVVHHLGTKYLIWSKENKSDNRIENLELRTKKTHSSPVLLREAQKRIIELEKEIHLLRIGEI